MGNVQRVDKTLATNEMVYYLRKSAELQRRWRTERVTVCREFGLTRPEIEALESPDPRVLMDLGVHQYLVPHILRLTYGTSNVTNNHPSLKAYADAFPRETDAVLEGTKWRAKRGSDG